MTKTLDKARNLSFLKQEIARHTSPSTKALYRDLDNLSRDTRRILWVLSVLHEPATQTTLKTILALLDWVPEKRGLPLEDLVSKPWREKLESQKLLIRERGRMACNPHIIDVLSRQAQANGVYAEIAGITEEVEPKKKGYYLRHEPQSSILRSLREALYLNTELETVDFTGLWSIQEEDYYRALFQICFTAFDPNWFATLPENSRVAILTKALDKETHTAKRAIAFAYLEQHWQNGTLNNLLLRTVLAERRVSQGRLEKVAQVLPDNSHWRCSMVIGMLKVLQGDYEGCLPEFELALKTLRKVQKKRSLELPGFGGILFLLAMARSENPRYRKLLESLCKNARHRAYGGDEQCYRVIGALELVLSGTAKREQLHTLDEQCFHGNDTAQLLACLCWHWLGDTPHEDMLDDLAENVMGHENNSDHQWYLYQSFGLLKHFNYKGHYKAAIEARARQQAPNDFRLVLDLIQPKQAWERALDALNLFETLGPKGPSSETDEHRVVWALDLQPYHGSLTPKEQKRNKSGAWTKGRNIPLKRLYESPEEVACLIEADQQICRTILCGYGFSGNPEYEIPLKAALRAAAGHPHIYREGRYDRQVEVSCGEPELIVKAEAAELLIQLSPHPGDENSTIVQDGEFKVRVVHFSDPQRHIARILGESGLRVPIEAREQALKSINTIAPLLAIQSDIGGGNIDAQQQEADACLYMQIEARDSCLHFAMSMRPLGVHGPWFQPGEGRQIVMAKVDTVRLQTQRDLTFENQAYAALLEHCSLFRDESWGDQSGEWFFDEQQSLEALMQLKDYRESLISNNQASQNGNSEKGNSEYQLELLWPEGGKIKLGKEAGLSQMRASVRQADDWFELQGQLTLDDGEVLAMSALMDLIQNSSGRFIKLNDDTFITLTQQLRKRLDAISKQGAKQLYHPLALGALDELTAGMQVEGDSAWAAQKNRIEEAHSLTYDVPATLQAELRDYQVEGYAWLARLAHWGAGACLADDMGLGKTMQSLALILRNAAQGPSLVLAPTSVCANWLNEAKQFAPTLKPLRFGGGNRREALNKAGPFDLIVCSYGLLQTEQLLLQEVKWQTIVADEAQALKNANTKRAKAAMKLQAEFRMATTGTPIENHLGELWSLFRFINPGLLGSLESFNNRFAGPIENQQDNAARQHLKRLVQPFILRRLKAEVLPELPARTEITIHVSLSREEQVLYETLRRKALENLHKSADKDPQQLKVFAEIMRLRRACCHPKLVVKNSNIRSAKLEAFSEILEELLENNHRALVFSQFVDHLQIIKKYLDERELEYQYLDGSTSVKNREKAINNFQNGQGAVFLISLKAGGSGLNLTAADYVVHMDPWWNPAVEDQASDRAHRLGQKRPVTIYRLVTENTIEEKIIALHKQKRGLADSLLEGSDLSGKLNAKDIMNLIAES